MKRIDRYISISQITNASIDYVDCTISIETIPSVQIHWGRIGRDLIKLGRAIGSGIYEAMVMSDVSLSALALAAVMP